MKGIILFVAIILFGCSNKNQEQSKISEKINTYEAVEADTEFKEIYGIYLPELYINSLLETKSHAQASEKLGKEEIYNAIVISPEKIFYIINFHEGVNRKILNKNSNEYFIEQPYDENNKILIIDNNKISDENNNIYILISMNYSDYNHNILLYITEIIFENKQYYNSNNEIISRLENGNILYKNEEYELHLDTVAANKEYDYLRKKNGQNIYFKIIDEKCIIYKQIIPDEWIDDMARDMHAEYLKEDEFIN